MAIQKDTANTSFQLAADFIKYTNASVFLTGKAGTGKTTFLKYCKENEIKNSVIVAPTGVAAMNAGGTTIHSFFQLPFGTFVPTIQRWSVDENIHDKHSLISRLRLSAERKEVMQKLELLIIDEISMVRADILDAIDTVLRHVRSAHSRPFGGVQVLLIGDMYQLPPVIKEEEWRILSSFYAGPYFFNSEVIEKYPPVYVELEKIYRQKDEAFVDILNGIRNNQLDKTCYELLHKRFMPDFVPGKDENYITLTTHNNKADAINSKEINKLPAVAHHFKAMIDGEFSEKSFPADTSLLLKVGTQVMFIKNDTEKIRRYFNGKIGVVQDIEEDKILVLCKNESAPIEVKKEKWRNIKYILNKSSGLVEEKEIGSFTQFPLRLAWAITIHKSQGLTFEKAVIDAGNAFAPGQVYVALSRCTSLEGLVLHSKINQHNIHNDNRIETFSKNQKTALAQIESLQLAKHDFQKEEIISLFDFSDGARWAKKIFSLITEDFENFTPDSIQWAERVVAIIAGIETIAAKFAPQLEGLLQDISLPENNNALQKRLIAAINHFTPDLEKLKFEIIHIPVSIDSKTVATDLNKLLEGFFQSISFKIHLYEACKNGFYVEEYLQQKRIYLPKALPVNTYAGKSAYLKSDSPNPVLYKLLRAKRDELCEQKDIAVYMVCNNVALEEMCTYLPQSVKELLQISGFGKVKAEQYGEQFLTVIRKYCEENDLYSTITEKPEKQKRTKKSETKSPRIDTKSETLRLYNFGKTIEEIASERALSVSTIQSHLAYYITEKEIEINDFVSPEKQKAIISAIDVVGQTSQKLIKESLTIDVEYGEIKFVLASLK